MYFFLCMYLFISMHYFIYTFVFFTKPLCAAQNKFTFKLQGLYENG